MENWLKGKVEFIWDGSVVVCEDKVGKKSVRVISECIMFRFQGSLLGLHIFLESQVTVLLVFLCGV